MIDLRKTKTPDGTDESRLANRLEEESIPFSFGELATGQQKKTGVFLVGNTAISFSPFSLIEQVNLNANRIKTQIWNKADLGQWHVLALANQLLVHP